MRNWRQTVLSQYSQSPRIVGLLDAIDQWISPDQNFQNFYDSIWNIDTAVGYGLDVWGRIVGISRILQVQNLTYFGFAEAIGSLAFNDGSFYTGANLTSSYSLLDEEYRYLILAKAAFNITNGTIPAINSLLLSLFPNRGNCYVVDGDNTVLTGQWFGFAEAQDVFPFNEGVFFSGIQELGTGNMTLTYVFQFPLTPIEVAIVENSGVLPKPVGVKAFYQYG